MDISEILESSSSDDEEDCPAEENEEEKEKEAKKEEEEPVGPIPDNMETLFVCFCFLVKVISPCVCSRLRVYIYIVWNVSFLIWLRRCDCLVHCVVSNSVPVFGVKLSESTLPR